MASVNRAVSRISRVAALISVPLDHRRSAPEYAEIVKFIKEKDFGSIRKWVGSNEIDPNTLFRKIYDGMYDTLKPNSIPQAVLILADYQYKAAFVADQEINTVACLTELMVNCEFA